MCIRDSFFLCAPHPARTTRLSDLIGSSQRPQIQRRRPPAVMDNAVEPCLAVAALGQSRRIVAVKLGGALKIGVFRARLPAFGTETALRLRPDKQAAAV